jgi:CubicO group peptidase (beta-lactamase class C family)
VLQLPRTADALAAVLSDQGLAPCVAAGASVKARGAWRRTEGGDVTRLFDLASLTKPMTAVATAIAGLRGLDRSARLGSLVPAFEGTASEGATPELLLAHRAGLEAHIPVYLPLDTGDPFDATAALRTAANARREGCGGPYPDGGFPPVYSDLGYALVGRALATQAFALDAGDVLQKDVVARLGLEGVLGTARDLEARGVDVTEVAAATEDVPWRGGLVRGRVHDENAWALSGRGGSGHAGMFGTVDAVLRFGEAVLDGLRGEGAFGEASLSWLVVERPGGTLRAGFDGKSAQGSSAGGRFSPRSFGHLGFTGTSLWIDPDASVVAVLLTNRVWPSRTRAQGAIKNARPLAHDALHAMATALAAPGLRGGV